MVEVGDEVDDSGGVTFSCVQGFAEASSNVGHAAAKVDGSGAIALVAGVDAVAIALKNPFPVFRTFAEGLFEVLATPSFLPAVADAALRARVIEDPDVSGAGFTGAGGEFFDGAFVNLKIGLGEAFEVNGFGNGPKEFQAAEGPVIQSVTRDVQAETLEDGLLPIERKMISVLGDHELRGKTEGGQTSEKRAGGCAGDEG